MELDHVLSAEQAESTAAAEVQKVEALLGHYENLGTNAAGPSVRVLSAESKSETLVRPNSEEERQAIVQILVARLEAATAKRERTTQDLARQQKLFERGFLPSSELEAARAAAAQAEAEVKELNIKIEFYKTDPNGQ